VLELHVFLEAQRNDAATRCRWDRAAGWRHLVVDDAGQQVGNPLQQLIDIQNRGQLAADLGQQRQLPRLTRDARVQACVFDTDCDADANNVSRRLCSSLNAQADRLHIDDADNLFLAISGAASSERAPGAELMKFSSAQHR